jgi:hypothetical protein
VSGNISIQKSLKNTFRLVYLVVLFSVCAVIASAQTARPTPPPAATDDGGRGETFEVRLPVTVNDKKKKKNLVAGLTRGDFVRV